MASRTTAAVLLVAALALAVAGVANAQTSVCESESECWVTLNGAAGENEYVYRYTTDEDCGVDVVALFPHGSTSFLSASSSNGTATRRQCDDRDSCDDGPACCFAAVPLSEGLIDSGTNKAVYITAELSSAASFRLNVERETACLDLKAIGAVVVAVLLFGCLPFCGLVILSTLLCYCFGVACFKKSKSAAQAREAGAPTYSNKGQPVYGNAAQSGNGAGVAIQMGNVHPVHLQQPQQQQPYPGQPVTPSDADSRVSKPLVM